MQRKHLLSVLLIIACPSVWACKPTPPDQYYPTLNKRPATMMLSSNGQYLMKILPGHFTKQITGGWVEDRVSLGIAYQITQQGTLEQLWTIKNVLPSIVDSSSGAYYLADDGVHLIKLSSARSVDDKNALVIYNRGQIFRNYAPKTFMPNIKENPNPVPCVSPVKWLFSSYQQDKPNSIGVLGTNFMFKTIDGKLWNFDVRQPPK